MHWLHDEDTTKLVWHWRQGLLFSRLVSSRLASSLKIEISSITATRDFGLLKHSVSWESLFQWMHSASINITQTWYLSQAVIDLQYGCKFKWKDASLSLLNRSHQNWCCLPVAQCFLWCSCTIPLTFFGVSRAFWFFSWNSQLRLTRLIVADCGCIG